MWALCWPWPPPTRTKRARGSRVPESLSGWSSEGARERGNREFAAERKAEEQRESRWRRHVDRWLVKLGGAPIDWSRPPHASLTWPLPRIVRDEGEWIPARCARIYSALFPRAVALSGSSFLSSTLFSLFTEAGGRHRGWDSPLPSLTGRNGAVRRHCSSVHADGVHAFSSCNQPLQGPQFMRKEKN